MSEAQTQPRHGTTAKGAGIGDSIGIEALSRLADWTAGVARSYDADIALREQLNAAIGNATDAIRDTARTQGRVVPAEDALKREIRYWSLRHAMNSGQQAWEIADAFAHAADKGLGFEASVKNMGALSMLADARKIDLVRAIDKTLHWRDALELPDRDIPGIAAALALSDSGDITAADALARDHFAAARNKAWQRLAKDEDRPAQSAEKNARAIMRARHESGAESGLYKFLYRSGAGDHNWMQSPVVAATASAFQRFGDTMSTNWTETCNAAREAVHQLGRLGDAAKGAATGIGSALDDIVTTHVQAAGHVCDAWADVVEAGRESVARAADAWGRCVEDLTDAVDEGMDGIHDVLASSVSGARNTANALVGAAGDVLAGRATLSDAFARVTLAVRDAGADVRQAASAYLGDAIARVCKLLTDGIAAVTTSGDSLERLQRSIDELMHEFGLYGASMGRAFSDLRDAISRGTEQISQQWDRFCAACDELVLVLVDNQHRLASAWLDAGSDAIAAWAEVAEMARDLLAERWAAMRKTLGMAGETAPPGTAESAAVVSRERALVALSSEGSARACGGPSALVGSVEVHVHGNVYGVDDLATAVSAIVNAQMRRAAYGA